MRCGLEKSLDYLEETVGRNMDVKGDSAQVSEGNLEHVIGNRRKCDPCYKASENLAELYSSILWKVVELVNEDIGYLAEENSKQSVEGAAGFSLLLIVKCERRERN